MLLPYKKVIEKKVSENLKCESLRPIPNQISQGALVLELLFAKELK